MHALSNTINKAWYPSTNYAYSFILFFFPFFLINSFQFTFDPIIIPFGLFSGVRNKIWIKLPPQLHCIISKRLSFFDLIPPPPPTHISKTCLREIATMSLITNSTNIRSIWLECVLIYFNFHFIYYNLLYFVFLFFIWPLLQFSDTSGMTEHNL